jgi:tRNA pseudouridine55 synthase
VVVHELTALTTDGALLLPHTAGTCELHVRVRCSAGTYVRVLAEAIGANLGAGAHLSALRRKRAGAFSLNEAVTLAQLNELAEAGRANAALLPMAAALSELPSAHLTAEAARRIRHGAAVWREQASWVDGALVKLYDDTGALLAVGVYDSARRLLRSRVLLALENNH